ncbi:hypothetical protein MTO96_034282 [Rhipicephalus appendiculatus]
MVVADLIEFSPQPHKQVTELVLCALSYGTHETLDAGATLTLPTDGLCDYLFVMGLAVTSTAPKVLGLNSHSTKVVGDVLKVSAAYTRTELGVALAEQ